MQRATYRHAIAWLAENDDNDWLADYGPNEPGVLSVAASLVADLFAVADIRVAADLRRALMRR